MLDAGARGGHGREAVQPCRALRQDTDPALLCAGTDVMLFLTQP